MICWTISSSTMVPREMQFKVVLANFHGKDALIAAGTGSGKTLPIALSILQLGILLDLVPLVNGRTVRLGREGSIPLGLQGF
jgi:superfamily II DNA/RNA helicase